MATSHKSTATAALTADEAIDAVLAEGRELAPIPYTSKNRFHRDIDEASMAAVCKEVVRGLPTEHACAKLRIDSREVDRIRREGDLGRGDGFAQKLAVDLASAEACFVSGKLEKLLNGNRDEQASAVKYLEIFRPQWSEKQKLRLQYELLGIINAIADELGVEVATQVAEVLSRIDAKAMALAQDAYLLPTVR